jgi:hypothetical protein
MPKTSTVVVNFRTMPNGSYRYMRGLRRGWYRLLDVQDPRKSTAVTSRNVISVLAESREGIEGVMPRSHYYIGDVYERFAARAAAINARRDAEFNTAVHHAEAS